MSVFEDRRVVIGYRVVSEEDSGRWDGIREVGRVDCGGFWSFGKDFGLFFTCSGKLVEGF